MVSFYYILINTSGFLSVVCLRQNVESESWDRIFFDGSTAAKDAGALEKHCVQIPILPVSGLVLFPGQTLPLNLLDAREISIIRHAADDDRVVGILTTKYVCHI